VSVFHGFEPCEPVKYTQTVARIVAQFETHDDGVEVNGQTVAAFLDGTPSAFEDRAADLLAAHGIEEPQPGRWYPQQAWLDAFAEIADNVGKQTLRRIGGSIPDNADWPPDATTVAEGIESIDDAYQMNHRGGEIGQYVVESIGDGDAVVRCTNPYPCAFDRGVLDAVAAEFGGGVPSLDEVGDDCRETGGDECVYELSW
jgi:hypothetical protein